MKTLTADLINFMGGRFLHFTVLPSIGPRPISSADTLDLNKTRPEKNEV